MSGVPVMARELINHPDFAQPRPLQPDDAWPAAGRSSARPGRAKIDAEVATARPGTGYGMTETCGIITPSPPTSSSTSRTAPGRPCRAIEWKCVDDEGIGVATGDIGELWVRGAQVIKGYLNRPEATAETITDGWLHTGDVARVDEDGFIFIVDRKKDMVLRGGENVYCVEVEAGHPSPSGGGRMLRVRRPRRAPGRGGRPPPSSCAPANRQAPTTCAPTCAAITARHKIPRFIWFLTEPLPRNASGKFLKRELREFAVAEAAA